ncbi:MAG: DNA polymerase II small subunit [Euryarchaeota archaeon]|nr:DNA polymerase II small subunit [Euryarchaeota archaeon]|tara:strand:- start:2690 stop:4312 length:1623 start_codon:yes stop_codon:yes gene_type:complete
MVSGDWAHQQKMLSAAGLLVMGLDAKDKIEQLVDINALIEAARASNVQLLTSQSIDQLLSLVSIEQVTSEESHNFSKKSQVTLPTPDNPSPIGRVIAPVSSNEISPAPRPHGLSHYSIDDFPMLAKDIDSEIEVHFDITGNSVTEGKLSDIKSFFNSRLSQIRNLMIEGRALPRRPISNAEAYRNRQRYTSNEYEITIVGLVSEPRWAKSGNLMFLLEDETTQIQCLLKPPTGANPLHAALDGLMNDDVVGVSGFFIGDRTDLFIISNIHFPPLPRRAKNTANIDESVSAAFLSDVHVGSKTFLEPQWEKMINWFKTDPLAKTIKYFVLSGDGVDGVGIYPGQDRHLAITDLFKQYGALANLLSDLPDWVDVIILPGNHDAVRPAEPQPALDPEVQQDYSDAVFVGNPCDFSLHGVRILSYHGKSIDDFVAGLRSVTYAKPEMAMRSMLERRHLAPSWGGKTPLSPEPEDSMVIGTIPDIFVTGHVHGQYVGDHKGTTIVHSSTWQDQTDYQRMLGFQPKPCILTVINLHTHASASIPFA